MNTPSTTDSNFRSLPRRDGASTVEPVAVIEFWLEAGPKRWFAKDEEFDARFRDRFLLLHEAAARGDCDGWATTAAGALALILLLDQFPRNCFRGSARSFATDGQARAIALQAIDRGDDRVVDEPLQPFFYMPLMHSEVLADQERCVELSRRIGGSTLQFAVLHRDIVARFGRFPHRNALLGRSTTAPEQAFLDAGGFKG